MPCLDLTTHGSSVHALKASRMQLMKGRLEGQGCCTCHHRGGARRGHARACAHRPPAARHLPASICACPRSAACQLVRSATQAPSSGHVCAHPYSLHSLDSGEMSAAHCSAQRILPAGLKPHPSSVRHLMQNALAGTVNILTGLSADHNDTRWLRFCWPPL